MLIRLLRTRYKTDVSSANASIMAKEPLYDLALAREMASVALPSIIQQSTVSIGMMVVQSVVNSFGAESLAGYSVGMRIENFCTVPCTDFRHPDGLARIPNRLVCELVDFLYAFSPYGILSLRDISTFWYQNIYVY